MGFVSSFLNITFESRTSLHQGKEGDLALLLDQVINPETTMRSNCKRRGEFTKVARSKTIINANKKDSTGETS